jgi:hypothetical protein
MRGKIAKNETTVFGIANRTVGKNSWKLSVNISQFSSVNPGNFGSGFGSIENSYHLFFGSFPILGSPFANYHN